MASTGSSSTPCIACRSAKEIRLKLAGIQNFYQLAATRGDFEQSRFVDKSLLVRRPAEGTTSRQDDLLSLLIRPDATFREELRQSLDALDSAKDALGTGPTAADFERLRTLLARSLVAAPDHLRAGGIPGPPDRAAPPRLERPRRGAGAVRGPRPAGAAGLIRLPGISCTRSADLSFEISNSRFQIRDFRFGDFKFEISNSRFQIRDFQFRDFKFEISNSRFQIRDFRFEISDFQNRNFKSMIFRF